MPDMKRKPVQKLRAVPEVESTGQAEYPWGLRITCEKEELGKLNIDLKDYDIGDIVKFNIKTEVVSLSSSESFEGADNKSIAFQITNMTVAKDK